jgi:hypothetical protein
MILDNTINLPKRRYAIFSDIIHGEYAIVVKEDDIEYAEKWGAFVSWLGPIRDKVKISKKVK